jgi:hypothetical protein
MRRFRDVSVVCLLLAGTPAFAADRKDPLDRARQLYNQGEFDAAIVAADEARRLPDRADAADLIAARAYLERSRATLSGDDLAKARERLLRINPRKFTPRERIELLVGYGEALYFDDAVGAAAAIFESVLSTSGEPNGELGVDGRDRVLDWWANALDRDAKPRPEIERRAVYQQIRDRMNEELAANPASATASYWVAAAARGQGDLQGAWDAAAAGWVRSPLAAGRATLLREDLDQLVNRAIVPERARVLGQPPETLLAEWERFKAKWGR